MANPIPKTIEILRWIIYSLGLLGRLVSAQMYVDSTVITPAMQVVATASIPLKIAT